MRKKRYIILLVLSLLIIPIASAEIIITQPSALYNMGDNFDITVTLAPNEETTDFLLLFLSCSGESIEMYRSPHSLAVGEKKDISFSTKLEPFLISDKQGLCHIQATYGGELQDSQEFSISNKIIIDFSLSKENGNPGETINAHGTATKENGQPLNGFVEITAEGLGLKVTETVTGGAFDFSLIIPEDAIPGQHILKARIYENNVKGEIINSGESASTIEVNQVVEDIDMEVDLKSVVPGEKLEFKPVAYDQIGSEMTQDATVRIYQPDNKVAKELLVKTGEKQAVKIATTGPPGLWAIEINSANFTKNRTFLVEELAMISYELTNETLRITNIGNIVYEKPVEVSIGGETRVITLWLGLGEYRDFKLSAPTGKYSVLVKDNDKEEDLGYALLTGRAISVKSASDFFKGGTYKIAGWLFLILVLAIIAFYLYRKIVGKPFIGHMPKFLSRKSKTGEAQVPVTVGGRRERATIIALKINNITQVKQSRRASDSIEVALLKVKEMKAKIYMTGIYRVILFVPIITKEKENSRTAIKAAKLIKGILDAYNRANPSHRIKYGIGMNEGEVVVDKKDSKFRFTTVGKTVMLAKKLSGDSDNDIIISEEMHKKTVGTIRSERVSSQEWRVPNTKTKYPYNEFIKKFEKKRQDKEKSKKS